MPARRTFLAKALAGVAAVMGAALASRSNTASASPAPQGLEGIEGSWVTSVPRGGGRPPLTTLITFTADGGFVQTNSEHPIRSPAHGAWVRVGERGFAATWVALRFDEAGNFLGTRKIRALLRLSETLDEWSSENIIDDFDLGGNRYHVGRTRSRAKRITVEGLG